MPVTSDISMKCAVIKKYLCSIMHPDGRQFILFQTRRSGRGTRPGQAQNNRYQQEKYFHSVCRQLTCHNLSDFYQYDKCGYATDESKCCYTYKIHNLYIYNMNSYNTADMDKHCALTRRS